jgi:hypothetical protein
MPDDITAHLAAGARWLRVLDSAHQRARGSELDPKPEFDPIRLLQLLEAQDVRYVLIGGVAMRFYYDRRLTDNLDICYAHERENCARLARVLSLVHARRENWPADLPDILDESALYLGTSFMLMTDFGRFDLLAEPSGTQGYNDLLVSASSIGIAGIPVKLASREAMLRMKRAADRPKDRIDVLTLEEDSDAVS